MRKPIQYTDESLGDFRIVADFLPSPKELKFKSANTKVTISLSSESVAYFKAVAVANGMQYQKIIRKLLDVYVGSQKAAEKPKDKHSGATYGVREPADSPLGAAGGAHFCFHKGKRISIDDALNIRGAVRKSPPAGTFRCVECEQPVHPHKPKSTCATGATGHFEHAKRNSDCSLSKPVKN